VAFRGQKVRQSIAFGVSQIVFQMSFNLDQKSSQTPCLQGFAYLKLVLLSLFS